jgi:hypothetical protein
MRYEAGTAGEDWQVHLALAACLTFSLLLLWFAAY